MPNESFFQFIIELNFIGRTCNQHIAIFVKKLNYFFIYNSANNPPVQNLLKIFLN